VGPANDIPVVRIVETNQLARAIKVDAYTAWLEFEENGATVQVLVFHDEFEYLEDNE